MRSSFSPRVGLLASLAALGLSGCVGEPTTPQPQLDPGAPLLDESPGGHSHWRYGHLTWQPRSDLGPRTIEFNYSNAFRRSGYSGTASDGRPQPGDIITESIGATGLNFGDGSSQTGTLRYLVTSVNVAEDWLFVVALHPGTNSPGIIHTYPANGTYTASSYSCCRIGSLQNGANGGYGVSTRVTVGTGNRSPVSNITPIIVATPDGPQRWTIPAFDSDGDRLRFRMATPTEAGSSFGGGLAQPSGMTVDAQTGTVTWHPSGLPFGLYWTQQIIEELDAQGNVKGFVAIDYLVRLQQQSTTNRAPTFTMPQCGGTQSILVGQTLTLPVRATDPDNGDIVTLNVAGVPPGATFNSTPGNPATGTLSWSPLTSQTGPQIVTFSATDGGGLLAQCSYTIIASFQADVWPGSISFKRTSSVWVTVLSTPDFDATAIDLSTVTLGDGQGTDTPMLKRANGTFYFQEKDFNNDGRMDRVLFFSVPALKANGDMKKPPASSTPIKWNPVLRGQTTTTGGFRAVPRVPPTLTP